MRSQIKTRPHVLAPLNLLPPTIMTLANAPVWPELISLLRGILTVENPFYVSRVDRCSVLCSCPSFSKVRPYPRAPLTSVGSCVELPLCVTYLAACLHMKRLSELAKIGWQTCRASRYVLFLGIEGP